MKRRKFIKYTLGSIGIMIASSCLKLAEVQAAEKIIKLTLSDREWKKKLTLLQYNILRKEGTERAYTSALLNEHRKGVFACIGCDLPLFLSQYKYDSGTGWPSFFMTIPNHLATKIDYTLLSPRIEYHCARCGGHHGHVFNDGPKPTGLRYCNNGAVLQFIPGEQ